MRMDQYRRNLLPHMLGQYAAQMYAVAGDAPAESAAAASRMSSG